MSLRDPDDPNAQRYEELLAARAYAGKRAPAPLPARAQALFPKQEPKG